MTNIPIGRGVEAPPAGKEWEDLLKRFTDLADRFEKIADDFGVSDDEDEDDD